MVERFGKYPNVQRGHQYALDVVAGKIPNSKFIIGACKRYLKDLDNKEADFYFSPEKAEHFLTRVQKFTHVIGTWDTKNIVLEPWQCFIFSNIMGFLNNDSDFRRFRISHVEIPRGNSKSTMASMAALYFLALDNPRGNMIAAAATKKEQARIVLDAARAMAKNNPSFLNATGVKVLAHKIIHASSDSEMRALSSEHSGLDGLNDVLAILDELHAMKRETFDVIYSGMSKRKDSLTLCITTAGADVSSVGHSQSAYAKKLCLGEVEDEQMFAVVYTIDEGDDVFSELTWKKANPNYGVSVDPVTFKAKAMKALETPADLPNFKIKHLNIWISEAHAFFDTTKWIECKDVNITLDMFKNKPCRMGIDLASHIDLTSIGLVFKQDDKYFLFDKTFIPEKTIAESKNKTLYLNAVGSGHLVKTPGEAINYDFITSQAQELAKHHRVLECLYDSWNATEMAQNLSDKIEMVKFPMNVGNFSEPTKKFDSLMRQKKLVHNGSPLLAWCISNVVAKEDHNQNVFPKKGHRDLKIDPVIALIMALAGWLQGKETASVYESRGFRRI